MHKSDLATATRALQLLALVAIAAFACFAQQTAVHLREYHAVVSFSSPGDANVRATMKLEPAVLPQRLLIVYQPGQTVRQLLARQGSTAIQVETTYSPGAMAITVPENVGAPGADLEIYYSVHADRRLTRVPLPVLNAPPRPQERQVLIEASLAEGMVAIGEGFPALSWRDHQHGEAKLAAVPSVLAIETRAAGGVSWFDVVTTPAALTTSAMCGLLLLGSACWYARAQSASRRSG